MIMETSLSFLAIWRIYLNAGRVLNRRVADLDRSRVQRASYSREQSLRSGGTLIESDTGFASSGHYRYRKGLFARERVLIRHQQPRNVGSAVPPIQVGRRRRIPDLK